MDDSRGPAPKSVPPASDDSQPAEDRATEGNTRVPAGRLTPRVVSPNGELEMPSTLRAVSARPLPSPAERLEAPLTQPRIYPEPSPDGDRLPRQMPQPDDRRAAGGSTVVPPMPSPRTPRWSLELISFLALFALPLALVSLYYGLIASNQYVSEFHFSVRSQAIVTAPMASLSSTGISPSPTQSASTLVSTMSNQADPQDMLSNYTIIDYLTSQQAVADLETKLPLKSYFTTKDADWLARLKQGASREHFVKYWQGMINADYDSSTGIAIIKVRAFHPADALAIANTLMESSERVVNEIESRAREDSVNFAQKMVDHDQAQVLAINKEYFDLRKKSGTIEPNANFVNENNQVSLALVQSLVQLRTQYAAQLSQMHNPDAPTLKALRDQIAATEDQLAQARGNVGNSAKGEVLPAVVGQFETASLKMQLAQQSLTASIANLEAARASAISQTLYVMNHVMPQLPERSEYPRRILTIGLVALSLFGAWLGLILMVHTIRNHLM